MGDRGGIEALLDLMDEAFRGRGIEESNESQAVLANLATVTETAWTALPVGEINHLRSLLGTDDRWRFQQLGFG